MLITHILFDFDGTLVNTIDSLVNIVEQIVTEKNRLMTDEIRGKFLIIFFLLNLQLSIVLFFLFFL